MSGVTRHALAVKDALRSLATLIAKEAEWSRAILDYEKRQNAEKPRAAVVMNDLDEQCKLLIKQLGKHLMVLPIEHDISMLSSDYRVLYTARRESPEADGTDRGYTISRHYIDALQSHNAADGYRWIRKRLPGEPEGAGEEI